MEGHDTHPRDIDCVLYHADYSNDAQKKALQLEAVARREVQRLIDNHDDLQADLEHLIAATNKVCAENFRKSPTLVV
jgi:hypothetical protein